MMALAATMPVRALGGITGNRTIPLKNPRVEFWRWTHGQERISKVIDSCE